MAYNHNYNNYSTSYGDGGARIKQEYDEDSHYHIRPYRQLYHVSTSHATNPALKNK